MRSLGEIVNQVATDVARSQGLALHGGGETGFAVNPAESEAAFLATAQDWLRRAVGETGAAAAPAFGESRPLAA